MINTLLPTISQGSPFGRAVNIKAWAMFWCDVWIIHEDHSDIIDRHWHTGLAKIFKNKNL